MLCIGVVEWLVRLIDRVLLMVMLLVVCSLMMVLLLCVVGDGGLVGVSVLLVSGVVMLLCECSCMFLVFGLVLKLEGRMVWFVLGRLMLCSICGVISSMILVFLWLLLCMLKRCFSSGIFEV